MTWAFGLSLKPSSLKFLLVALADNADDQGRAFPSVETLAGKTSQDRKTVIAGLDRLEELNLATDTGGRVGKTKQVKVYRLDRFIESNSPENATVSKNSSENGILLDQQRLPKTEPFQNRNSSEFILKGSQKRTSSPSSSPLKLPSSSPAPLEPSGISRARARRAPAEFQVTDDLRAWAKAKCPAVDVDAETEKWRDHEYAEPKSDWRAAWRTWMRRAPEFHRNGTLPAESKSGWRPGPDD